MVDDGVDAESEDIKDNFNADGSWDFNNNGKSPLPRLFDDYHGTRCAGEIAAVKNDVCGIGVAWKSQVSGIRILSGPITSADEASAMIYGLDHNDIYSCSWGPTDNGRVLSEPEVIVKKAMIKGIQEGRDKKVPFMCLLLVMGVDLVTPVTLMDIPILFIQLLWVPLITRDYIQNIPKPVLPLWLLHIPQDQMNIFILLISKEMFCYPWWYFSCCSISQWYLLLGIVC